MDFLGHICKLDSPSQRRLDSSFARALGGKVVPNELEGYLKQETEDFLIQDANGQYLVPSNFRVGISVADCKNLSVPESNLPNQLVDCVIRYCRNNGRGFTGSISVHLQTVESLHIGQPRTASTFTEGTVSTSKFVPSDDSAEDADSTDADVAPSQSDGESRVAETSTASHLQLEAKQPLAASRPIPAASPEATTELSSVAVDEGPSQEKTVTLLLQGGSSCVFEVRHGSNIIGHGTASDPRLSDIGVSRQHAEVTWDGQDTVLVDLYSANGTTINGESIDNWLPADDDGIPLGHSVFEIQIRQVVRFTRFKCHYPRSADTFLG